MITPYVEKMIVERRTIEFCKFQSQKTRENALGFLSTSLTIVSLSYRKK